MSNYTIAVNWSGKDSLSDADPAKVLSGSDFNTEFTTVQTAVNTKADVNGSATESFSATTATAGTNTTQVATTAFVTTAAAAAYPIGSLYMNASSSANPASLLGFGTWSSFGAGRVLLGEGGGYANGSTGGATTAAHTLTEAEMPSHTHTSLHGGTESGNRPTGWVGVSNSLSPNAFGGGTDDDDWATTKTTATGSGGAHSHSTLQPYIVVYMWKRTA